MCNLHISLSNCPYDISIPLLIIYTFLYALINLTYLIRLLQRKIHNYNRILLCILVLIYSASIIINHILVLTNTNIYLLNELIYNLYNSALYLTILYIIYLWTTSLMYVHKMKTMWLNVIYIILYTTTIFSIILLDVYQLYLYEYFIWAASCFVLWLMYMIVGLKLINKIKPKDYKLNSDINLYYHTLTIFIMYTILLPLYMLLFIILIILNQYWWIFIVSTICIELAGIISSIILIPIIYNKSVT